MATANFALRDLERSLLADLYSSPIRIENAYYGQNLTR